MTTLWARRDQILPGTAFALVGVFGAFVLSVGSAHLGSTSLPFALAFCALPAVPVLLARPDICALFAIALLPFVTSVTGGSGGSGGVAFGVPDVFLALTALGLVLRFARDAELRQRLTLLRPLLIPVAVYVSVVFVVSVPNVTRAMVIKLAQQVEVIGLPLIIGAALFTAPVARLALRLFVVIAMVIAAAALMQHSVQSGYLGIQKNPAGQFVADALLLVLVLTKRLPVKLAVIAYLAVGMYFTYSRGAVLGVLVGLAAYLLVDAKTPLKLLWRLGVAAAVVFVAFSFLPNAAQDRLLGNVSTTEFNDKIRQSYISDAESIIRANPLVGVGIGNYLAGNQADLTQTSDPHNVFLLEAAEGGYPLLGAFLFLQLGTLTVVFLRRRDNPWAAPAIAVQVAIVTHSAVDVYWVRGTPVLGWLLLGLALGAAPPRRRAVHVKDQVRRISTVAA